MIPRQVAASVADACGSAIADVVHVSGGDINEVRAVRLEDGRRLFLKFHPGGDPAMFPAEARGLEWLAEAGTLAVPEVVATSASEGEVPWLLMELLEPGPRREDFDELFGRGLAALHRTDPGGFGLNHDNFIGRLPQSNTPSDAWSTFYREQRLAPQIEAAATAGLIGGTLRVSLDRLLSRLDDLVGPAEPPARLHGDLWGGNLHGTADGCPALIDPAVYGGHREMDLAMMQLFGGFSDRVFAAYGESWPFDPDWRDRVPLCQLYPVLVHVNLFGSSYVSGVEGIVARYA